MIMRFRDVPIIRVREVAIIRFRWFSIIRFPENEWMNERVIEKCQQYLALKKLIGDTIYTLAKDKIIYNLMNSVWNKYVNEYLNLIRFKKVKDMK